MKINYLEALENPSLRQNYLDYLVESSELKFPYVNEFRHITNEEAGKIKDRLCRSNEKELEKITAICSPNGEIQTNSTIYFTENNFSDNCERLIHHAVVSQNDFETAQRLELCYHEAVHSEHFGKGIDGFNLEEFKIETEEGKRLFLIASELDAHTKHIKELGNTKANSFYLREYQKFLIGMFKSYMTLLPNLVQQGFTKDYLEKFLRDIKS
ncbi:MAG: hypothetical protein AABW90_04265 [Nanoarchaeota archaeon]